MRGILMDGECGPGHEYNYQPLNNSFTIPPGIDVRTLIIIIIINIIINNNNNTNNVDGNFGEFSVLTAIILSN